MDITYSLAHTKWECKYPYRFCTKVPQASDIQRHQGRCRTDTGCGCLCVLGEMAVKQGGSSCIFKDCPILPKGSGLCSVGVPAQVRCFVQKSFICYKFFIGFLSGYNK